MSSSRDDNSFYRDHYQKFAYALAVLIIIMLGLAGVVLYQVTHRPLPEFYALTNNGKRLTLVSHDEPNQLPSTLIRFASKAVVAAYTYNFENYNKQLEIAHPYFTEAGWNDYRNSVNDLIQSIVQGQIIVNSVVSDTPIISQQGDEFDGVYNWRLQVPLLVTYQTAETTSPKYYIVALTIVKVPTQINPQGIGIDTFVMEKP